MNRLKNKFGSMVIESLIIISIMGALCITLNAVLAKKATARSADVAESVLESDKMDVKKIIEED